MTKLMTRLIPVVTLVFVATAASESAAFFQRRDVTDAQVTDAVLGSLAYLETMQIRQRQGKQSCVRDSSGGDGCSGGFLNIEGEWANQIQVLPLIPHVLPEDDRLPIYDSNMFVTTAILYPLYWLNAQDARVLEMRRLAIESVKLYKRGDAYNFWPPYVSRRTGHPIVGPINFRVDHFDISNSRIGPLASRILGAWFPWVKVWMNEIMDTRRNPGGMESFFNVPNDADDTSMAVAVLKLEGERGLDTSPLRLITQYRDAERAKIDARDTWTPTATGAYLTWLKDENQDTFATPETGVMPMGVNNVDCVVNANALFSLALNDMKAVPGFHASARYLADVIHSRMWLKKCAMYYPQIYTFPYSVTRAYRDAGARTPELDQAMDQLLADLIARQKNNGTWDSSVDGSRHYATAMALVSLLNLGENRAMRLGLQSRYENAIKKAVRYLYHAKVTHDLNESSFNKVAYKWSPGLFFSAEEPKLGAWRSTALTNAIVVEAFTKYLNGYHKSEESIVDGRGR